MLAGVAAALAAVCLAAGILFLVNGRKNKKRGYRFLGIGLIIAGIVFVLYLAAAVILIGGID